MKKIIFWGDGILAGPDGYGELLENHLLLHHPRADVSMSIQGREGTTLTDALREAPFHAIGKDPDLLFLAFGHADVQAGHAIGEILRVYQDLVSLVLQKTHARICLADLIPGFFPEEAEREICLTMNHSLRDLTSSRVSVLDLAGDVDAFLRDHRESPGDQRALHLDCGRLTPLGQLHLAHHAFRRVPWPDLSLAPSVQAR